MNATLMTEKQIMDWKVVPTKGGGVCLVGKVNDVETQTSNVVCVAENKVKTQSGSTYSLGQKASGMWEMQLRMRRPNEYNSLAAKGIVG